MLQNKIFNHDAIEYLNNNKSLPPIYTFENNEYNFIGLNTVFSPILFEDTFFFSDEIEVNKGDFFLEIGCGTGVISIIKAREGAITTSCDINHEALRNTKINAILNNVDSSVDIFYSNVFDSVENINKFDIIFWNMPFIYSEKQESDTLKKSCFSYKYANIEKYIIESKNAIVNGTKVMFGFSNESGSVDILDSIISREGLKKILLKEKVLSSDDELFFSVGLYILKVK